MTTLPVQDPQPLSPVEALRRAEADVTRLDSLWTPVAVALPPVNVACLVTTAAGKVERAAYRASGKFVSAFIVLDVTAWMPSPAPYIAARSTTEETSR